MTMTTYSTIYILYVCACVPIIVVVEELPWMMAMATGLQ
jgi:hypothetical protein